MIAAIPDHAHRSYSKAPRNRLILADAIESLGTETEMPCTYCFKNNKACVMSEGSSRCTECVQRGRSCDGVFMASARESPILLGSSFWSLTAPLVTRLLREQRKLEKEEAEVEEALFILQTQLSTAVNRLARIRRLKKSIKAKSSETFKRGIQGLDEEDGARLSIQKSHVAEDLHSFRVSDPID